MAPKNLAILVHDDVEVLEAFELDRVVEVRVDPVVADLVLAALHVRREARAVAPAADHDQLTLVAVGLPDLQIDEAVGVVDEPDARAERGHELRGALDRNAQAGHRHVHASGTLVGLAPAGGG